MQADWFEPGAAEAVAAPDDVAGWAASVPPSGHAVAVLALVEPARLSHDGRVEAVAALERQKAWLEARQVQLLAALDAEPSDPHDLDTDKRWVQEELATRLHISPGSAGYRLDQARALAQRRATLRLLHTGVIGPRHTRLLLDALRHLAPVTGETIEQRVLAKAGEQTPHQFALSLRRAVLTLDPAGQAERHTRARVDRCIGFTPAEDGMSTGYLLLPAEDATAIDTVLTALTNHPAPDDLRTSDQRRADALTQLALDRLTGTSPTGTDLSTQQGRRPAIQVTVALSTLLGLDQQPAHLDGHGPIPAQLARQLAADPTGTWRRLITDPVGQLLDYGHTTYRPPQNLIDHTTTRDRTCRFPGCPRKAERCDLDHLTPYSQDGTTCTTNTECLCRRHHLLKHRTRWHLHGNPQATLTWTDPTGRHHHTHPAQHPIDQTMPTAGVPPDNPPPF
jgi:hypothetical protein